MHRTNPARRILTLVAVAMTFLALGARAGLTSELLVPSQYGTIGAAVDAAQEGDAILVAAGTYKEVIVLDTRTNLSITAQGEVYLDGNGATPLTIRGSTEIYVAGLRLTDVGATGIDLDASDRVALFKCQVTGASTTGVHVHGGGSAAEVTKCVIKGCATGILIEDDRGHYFRNKVFGATNTAISLSGASMNVVAKNKLYDSGDLATYGINIGFSSLTNTVHGNLISGSFQHGLRSSSSCLRTVMSENKVLGATTMGMLAGGDGNFVTGNSVTGCDGLGIAVMSADGVFTDNQISGCGGHGMLAGDGAATASNNVLRHNSVEDCGGDGIHVDDPDNVLVSNQLKKNAGADLSYAGAVATTTLLSNKADTIVP